MRLAWGCYQLFVISFGAKIFFFINYIIIVYNYNLILIINLENKNINNKNLIVKSFSIWTMIKMFAVYNEDHFIINKMH